MAETPVNGSKTSVNGIGAKLWKFCEEGCDPRARCDIIEVTTI